MLIVRKIKKKQWVLIHVETGTDVSRYLQVLFRPLRSQSKTSHLKWRICLIKNRFIPWIRILRVRIFSKNSSNFDSSPYSISNFQGTTGLVFSIGLSTERFRDIAVDLVENQSLWQLNQTFASLKNSKSACSVDVFPHLISCLSVTTVSIPSIYNSSGNCFLVEEQLNGKCLEMIFASEFWWFQDCKNVLITLILPRIWAHFLSVFTVFILFIKVLTKSF